MVIHIQINNKLKFSFTLTIATKWFRKLKSIIIILLWFFSLSLMWLSQKILRSEVSWKSILGSILHKKVGLVKKMSVHTLIMICMAKNTKHQFAHEVFDYIFKIFGEWLYKWNCEKRIFLRIPGSMPYGTITTTWD